MHSRSVMSDSCVSMDCSPPGSFSRQEYWSGLPFLPPGDPPDPGVEPVSPASLHWQADSGKSLILQNGSQFGIFIFNKQTSNET